MSQSDRGWFTRNLGEKYTQYWPQQENVVSTQPLDSCPEVVSNILLGFKTHLFTPQGRVKLPLSPAVRDSISPQGCTVSPTHDENSCSMLVAVRCPFRIPLGLERAFQWQPIIAGPQGLSLYICCGYKICPI